MNESEELAFIAEDVKAIAKDVFFYFFKSNPRALNQHSEIKTSNQE